MALDFRRQAFALGEASRHEGLSCACFGVYTDSMVTVDPTPRASNDPKGVKVHLSTGAGLEIDWKDGHHSTYLFKFLRDACPCALCEDERTKAGRKAGEPEKAVLGTLP